MSTGEPAGWLCKSPKDGLSDFEHPYVGDAWREPLTEGDKQAGWTATPLFVAPDDFRAEHDRRVNELLAANNREVENRRALTAALRECEDKLWVLRCNSNNILDRKAAERAVEMGKAARRGIAR